MRIVLFGLLAVVLTTDCGSFQIEPTSEGTLVTSEGLIITGVCEFELRVTLRESGGDETTFTVSEFTESSFIDLTTDYDEVNQIEVEVVRASAGCPFSAGDKWRWPPTGTGRLTKQNGKYRIDLHDFQAQDTGLDAVLED